MIKVSQIEKFATHDGPGIRTTIFLQGCSLRCPWCANPETWTMNPVLMHDVRKCINCQRCQKHCEQQAIAFLPEFCYEASCCVQCGNCVDECLTNALRLSSQSYEIDDVVNEVLKDKEYYENSCGGVTISGGEPLVQFEAFLELASALKQQGLHVAIETTGHYSLEKLKQVMPYVDLFLFDLKHIQPERFHAFTKGNLNLILNNLKYLASEVPNKVMVRIPVIPSFNYDEQTLKRMLEYVQELGIVEVNLLPYHTLGKNKWQQLNRRYTLDGYEMLQAKELELYVEYGNRLGLNMKIGG